MRALRALLLFRLLWNRSCHGQVWTRRLFSISELTNLCWRSWWNWLLAHVECGAHVEATSGRLVGAAQGPIVDECAEGELLGLGKALLELVNRAVIGDECLLRLSQLLLQLL